MIITKDQGITLHLSTLFGWFMIYSYIGWLYETAYCSIQAGRYVNRGFLYGPFCPIYGTSILLMILLFSGRCRNILSLFLYCAFIASLLEYLSSYTMELIFNRRWWDYSSRMLNINGRICVGAAVLFGICGVLIIKYLHPRIVRYLENNFSVTTLQNASRIIFAFFLFDVLVSIRMSL
jgi:uncharacterized membrane protein